jgi:hypothetical protein
MSENIVGVGDPFVPHVMTNLTSIDPDIQASRIMTCLKRISIQTLLSDGFHEEKNKSFWFTECQLLCIITPGTDGTSKAAVFNRSKSNGKINSTNYQQIFLFREYGVNGNQLFYMMVTRDINQALFERNIELRDNGVITIGSYFRIVAPKPINQLMNGDIPLLETNFPLIVLNPPAMSQKISVNMEIEGNASLAFVLNGTIVQVESLSPYQTNCAGLLCDKQRARETKQRGCGCFHFLQNHANVTFEHTISIVLGMLKIGLDTFSSTKFSLLYMKERLPPSIRISALRMTDQFFDLYDTMERVINFINANGGFTAIGWYRRGVINDRKMVENNANKDANGRQMNRANGGMNEEIQVDAGNISYHVAELLPTNRELLDNNTVLGLRLHAMKYDVSSFGLV